MSLPNTEIQHTYSELTGYWGSFNDAGISERITACVYYHLNERNETKTTILIKIYMSLADITKEIVRLPYNSLFFWSYVFTPRLLFRSTRLLFRRTCQFK